MGAVLNIYRFSNVLVIDVGSKSYYILPSDLSDPLFWQQPLNLEWVEELKEMVLKAQLGK